MRSRENRAWLATRRRLRAFDSDAKVHPLAGYLHCQVVFSFVGCRPLVPPEDKPSRPFPCSSCTGNAPPTTKCGWTPSSGALMNAASFATQTPGTGSSSKMRLNATRLSKDSWISCSLTVKYSRQLCLFCKEHTFRLVTLHLTGKSCPITSQGVVCWRLLQFNSNDLYQH